MSLKEKLEWCERSCRGRKINIVVGEEEHPELTDWQRLTTSRHQTENGDTIEVSFNPL